MKPLLVLSLLSAVATATPVQLAPRASTTAAVTDLYVKKGAPQHLAAGIIYGEPDTPNQIPDKFYIQAGLKYFRAGGAQLGAPSRGWIWNEYNGRFQSTLSNYRTARKYGGSFSLLPHDIWGTDNSNSSTVWPGDNGNWSDYDKFLDRLISDLKSNDMLEGLQFDIWNEPDLPNVFWKRTRQQWLDLYGRTHRRIRSDSALNGVIITGPTFAGSPQTSNVWWTSYLDYIKANNTIPDQYVWHLEGSPSDVNDDLQTNIPVLNSMLSARGLPQRPININEYATSAEQVPAGAAWWISRLERYDAIGMRGNWRSGYELHDYLANLLGKPNAGTSSYRATAGGYYPVGEWQVYKYYATNMTGTRASTTGTTDRLFDIYTVIGADKVRILSGARIQKGTWAITVNHLSAVGLPTSGNLNIQTWGFVNNGLYGEVDAPKDLGIVSHPYSGDSVTFPIYQTDTQTAYAFEFAVGK